MLLNACKDIGSVVNLGKTKHMEIRRHRDVMAHEHIRIGSNSYEKVKNLIRIFMLFNDKSKLYSR